MQISLKRKIKAPVDVVFDALSNEVVLSEYAGKCAFERKVGGIVMFFDEWVHGEVLKYLKNKELSYTWKPTDWPETANASVVTMTFLERGVATVIELTHENFPNDKEAENHKNGWEEYIFGPLEKYLIG